MWKLSSSPAFLMLHCPALHVKSHLARVNSTASVREKKRENAIQPCYYSFEKVSTLPKHAPELPNLYLRHLIMVPLRECIANRSTIFIFLFLLYLH
jgi:hypothetical protein